MKSLLIGNGLNLANNNFYLNIDMVKNRFFTELKEKLILFQKALYLDELNYDDIYKYIIKEYIGIEQLAGHLFDYIQAKVNEKRKFNENDNYRTIELIGIIALRALFIIDNQFIEPQVTELYTSKMNKYDKIFTLNYIESWDKNNNCIYLHGNISKFFQNYNGQSVTTNILIHNPEIKDYFKDNPVVLDLGEIIFVPDNKKVNKLSYVGTPYYPSNTLYPADDLFLKESKDIYEDLDNAESLDIFGVSPYGDKSLINKLMKIPQITIYVHNLNELEIMEWKKAFLGLYLKILLHFNHK